MFNCRGATLIFLGDKVRGYFSLIICHYFTKKVFGKPLKPLAQFHVHRSKKIPESIINGDNNMHIDRFLPNMKLYYAPFEITKDDAPFCYAVGSHKINSQYIVK